MPTREETARAFAAAMGWTILPWADPPTTLGMRGWVEFETRLPKLVRDNVRLPAHDAPLHEHLAFVGRVAEALNAFPTVTGGNVGKRTADGYRVQYEAHVAFDMPHIVDGVCYGQASADDPSWAAMLAAIEAKESKS